MLPPRPQNLTWPPSCQRMKERAFITHHNVHSRSDLQRTHDTMFRKPHVTPVTSGPRMANKLHVQGPYVLRPTGQQATKGPYDLQSCTLVVLGITVHLSRTTCKPTIYTVSTRRRIIITGRGAIYSAFCELFSVNCTGLHTSACKYYVSSRLYESRSMLTMRVATM